MKSRLAVAKQPRPQLQRAEHATGSPDRQQRRLAAVFFAALLTFVAACGHDELGQADTGVIITPLGRETASVTASISPTPTTPTSATTPGANLTPQAAVSADLDEAKRLESEGNPEEATKAYVNLIAGNNPSLRSEATLSAARLLLELEKPADAQGLLEPFVAAAAGRDVVARYLLARAYAALGMWRESLQQYDSYIQSGRPALANAYLDRGRALQELGQFSAAASSVQSGLGLSLAPSARKTFLLTLARISERAGNTAEAIRGYQDLIEASDSAADAALALSRIVALKRAQADPTYVVELNRLLTAYPGSGAALAALNESLSLGEPIEPATRGLVYYRQNDYTKAEPAFREQIDAAPSSPFSATAYYYYAAILESRDDLNGALAGYSRATDLDPSSVLADDALWWRARILEDRGNAADAQALFARIVLEYPQSSWAADAAFRRGMLSYGTGRHAEAADLWGAALATVTAPTERERLSFWRGKALLQAGNRDAARPILEQLAAASEDDYYGVRAVSILAGHHNQPKARRESRLDLSQSFDWVAAENWLTTRTGRAMSEAWPADPRWLRAQELWLIGLSSQGDAEAFDLIEAYAQDPIAMYTLSRRLSAEGRIGMSARAGQRLLRVLNTNPNAGLPRALLSLSYPPAFGSIAQRYAQNERISPLLLLAFVRQESFFDPRAESPAGALGLTQVLPRTGQAIARRLGIAAPETKDLLHAELNLRFGASYMAQQLRDFNNEIYVAFAAYNAGPEAARRWRRTAGEDADVFQEAVDYRETRLYIQIVAENYAIYRYLYAGEMVPNLPD